MFTERKILVVVAVALISLFSSAARAVTSKKNTAPIHMFWLTTPSAVRAESDLQVRRIKGLLEADKIDSAAFFAQVEELRKRVVK